MKLTELLVRTFDDWNLQICNRTIGVAFLSYELHRTSDYGVFMPQTYLYAFMAGDDLLGFYARSRRFGRLDPHYGYTDCHVAYYLLKNI